MIRLLARPSLFRRLLLIELLAAAAFWIVYVGFTFHSVYEQGNGFLDQDLRLISRSMARLAGTHSDEAGMRRVAEQIAALNYEASVPAIAQDHFAYQLWRTDGTLLMRSMHGGDMPLIPPRSIEENRRSRRGGWIVHGAYSNDGVIFAVAGYSELALTQLRRQLAKDAAVGYLWLVAALTLILWAATSIGLQPLRALANRIAARDQDDLTPVRQTVAYGELTALTVALNEKIERIRALLDRERAFFADAAHELRTPLAALEAQAHVLAMQSDGEERMRALRTFEAGIERAAAIVSKLLTMARLDSGSITADQQLVNIPALLEQLVARHAARAFAIGSRIELEAAEAPALNCDPQGIETAVDHLIDNAICHTPGGSVIAVRFRPEPEVYVIEVSDDGPGIPAPERERVFNRFVRLETALGQGSGLGLAIVRKVARMHGGDAHITGSVDDRGCCVCIRIPRDKRVRMYHREYT